MNFLCDLPGAARQGRCRGLGGSKGLSDINLRKPYEVSHPRFPFPTDCPIMPTDKGGSHGARPIPSPAPAAAKEADLEDSGFWSDCDFADFIYCFHASGSEIFLQSNWRHLGSISLFRNFCLHESPPRRSNRSLIGFFQ